MAIKIIHTIKRSTFLRLFVIFLISGVILLLLVVSSAHLISDSDSHIQQKFQNNIVAYGDFIIDKIGSPPNYIIAEKLSADYNLHIMIRSETKNWKSSNYTLPALTQLQQRILSNNGNVRVSHNFTYSYIIITKNNYDYVIAITHRRFADTKVLFIMVLILIVFAVMVLNYYLIKWLFHPLRLLDEGVKQVGEGNFDFRVRTKRQDEMGELVLAFNHMSDKIQSMMKEKQQLLMDVSHELRSPITRIKLALEFIIDTKSKQSIHEDIHEMEAMITELLESARLSNPNSSLIKEKIELNSFLQSIVKVYSNSKPGIIFKPSNEDLILTADRDRIAICLRNIIENALKYSDTQSEPIELEAKQKENTIIISITDYGEGIPLKEHNHIFEPFYRVDKSRNSETGGYGLGLNLCKKILNAHGGDILVESNENVQTTFSLVFPRI